MASCTERGPAEAVAGGRRRRQAASRGIGSVGLVTGALSHPAADRFKKTGDDPSFHRP
jgi:hypothetical protein